MAVKSKTGSPDTVNDAHLWSLLEHSASLISRAREIELAQCGITMEQMSILYALLNCGGSATIDELAAIIVRQHNSVSTIVNRMAKANLVKKEKRPDQKKYIVQITEKARGIVNASPRTAIETIFSNLSFKEKEIMANSVEKIISTGHDVLGYNFNLPFLSKSMITKDDLMSIDKLKNIKHPPNIIELRPWHSRHVTITAPMITALGPKDIPESNLGIGFAYVTKPETLIEETHQHPFDQWIFFIGGDGNNFLNFDADIEMVLDGVTRKVNYPCYIFVPKGMNHCPLVIKRVGKPLVFIDARTTEDASVRSFEVR
jgi:DNA-binding MarR family transcriptional regulator